MKRSYSINKYENYAAFLIFICFENISDLIMIIQIYYIEVGITKMNR